MPEDPRMIRAVEWKAVFPFLNLFRAFRIAIHPSKLLLALAMILTLYAVGRSMDWVWPAKFCWPESTYFSRDTTGRASQFLNDLPSREDMGRIGARDVRRGPFDVFLRHELTQLHNVTIYTRAMVPEGVFDALYRFVVVGPGWAFRNHPLYASVYSAVLLFAWSIFGGAITRVAAVHVARDEKISVRNALRFSSGKLLSFLFAPIIAALFIGALGLLIAVSNLVFYIPFIGPIAVGAIFFLTLAAGFVMTLALFGAIGGAGMMYPTIAVDGTDAFDSISRSYSYFFARPWRLALYSVISLVYGVITYLFLKLFVFVMLLLVHLFQSWLLTTSHETQFVAAFPVPEFNTLSYAIDFDTISGPGGGLGGKIGAVLLSIWYYLVVALLGAYAISFYFSANTIIYTLLRQDVDATELDDVYLEEMDDDELSEPVVSQVAPATVPPTADYTAASSGSILDAAASQDGSSDDNTQPPTFSASPLQ